MSSSPVLEAPRRYRLSVDDYHRMIDADVFAPGIRVELLAGVLWEMPPISRDHQAALMVLIGEFASLAAAGRLMVRMPFTLPPDSEPEPDLAVLAPDTPLGKPTVDQVVLAIEVADRTRRLDLRRKAPLYQRAGLLETWVLDLPEQRLVVFPREGGSVVYSRGQGARPTPRAVPEVTLDLDALFAEIPA